MIEGKSYHALIWDDPIKLYETTREGEKMKNIINAIASSKFVSRKFLLAVGAIITLVANKQFTEAAAVAGAYMAAEGYIDSKNV